MIGVIVMLVMLWPGLAIAAQNTLTWQDNSANEANFHIERTTALTVAECATATGFVQIATTGTNVTTFVDQAIDEGPAYCYRVRASNPYAVSGYSNVAGRSVPLPAPSGLQAGP